MTERNINQLLTFEDNWQTEMGASFLGERVVVRGRDLFTELHDFSWQKLLLFMITGREFDEQQLHMLDKIWALSVSYPDPRIWCNRVAALAATTRSTASLGVAAGSAVSEARIYGGQVNIAAIDFILECNKKVRSGEALPDIINTELKTNRAIYGYGRPVANGDERIRPIEKVMRATGCADGEHVTLAYRIEKYLMNGRWRMQMNIAGLCAAIGADIGFSLQEYYLWQLNAFSAGMTACYADAVTKPAGALFPLRCSRIKYLGTDKRAWK